MNTVSASTFIKSSGVLEKEFATVIPKVPCSCVLLVRTFSVLSFRKAEKRLPFGLKIFSSKQKVKRAAATLRILGDASTANLTVASNIYSES